MFQTYTEEYKARFKNLDPDGRVWADDNLTAKGLSGGGYEYEYKGAKSLWRCPLETMQRLDAEGRLHFTRAGGIRLKRYLDESFGLPCPNPMGRHRPSKLAGKGASRLSDAKTSSLA